MKKSRKSALLLIGGGLTAGAAAWMVVRRSSATVDAVKAAVSGVDRGAFNARLTGYWPFAARADERTMEGGTADRKGRPLHTLEQHLADPVNHPYVSVSGDDSIFPYGQKLVIDAWPQAVFRVVDTGGHFRGLGKVYRVAGYEPLDVCVDSSATKVPKLASVRIVVGDNFDGGKAVAAGGFRGQTVVTGLVDGRTSDDAVALARALASELGTRSSGEQRAAAWAIRNRADAIGVSVAQLLAPKGAFGPTVVSGGFASTRMKPTPATHVIAGEVLDAPESDDPTGGAVDFWLPDVQSRLHELGEMHRAAMAVGDAVGARRYARYANYGSEGDMRYYHAQRGLQPVQVVGAVELLGRCG